MKASMKNVKQRSVSEGRIVHRHINVIINNSSRRGEEILFAYTHTQDSAVISCRWISFIKGDNWEIIKTVILRVMFLKYHTFSHWSLSLYESGHNHH